MNTFTIQTYDFMNKPTEELMTYEESAVLLDELSEARGQLVKVQHLAQEALDGLSTIANLSEPHINRIRLQMRHKDDKVVFDAILVAYKQVQQRVALIVEELGEDE